MWRSKQKKLETCHSLLVAKKPLRQHATCVSQVRIGLPTLSHVPIHWERSCGPNLLSNPVTMCVCVCVCVCMCVCVCVCVCVRERERERERESKGDRKTDTKTDRDTETERKRDREKERRETDCRSDKQTGKQTHRGRDSPPFPHSYSAYDSSNSPHLAFDQFGSR